MKDNDVMVHVGLTKRLREELTGIDEDSKLAEVLRDKLHLDDVDPTMLKRFGMVSGRVSSQEAIPGIQDLPDVDWVEVDSVKKAL